jgi:hypothetical protein
VSAAGSLPRRATGPELAVLRHPDRRSAWVVLAVADLAARTTADVVAGRLARLAAAAPIVAARLDGAVWRTGAPGPVGTVPWSDDPGPAPAGLVAPFRLAEEPPVRVALADDGRRLVVAAHHAALDGRGLAAVVGALASDQPPVPTGGGAGGGDRAGPPSEVGPRLVRPATRHAAAATVTVVGRRLVWPASRVPGDHPAPEVETVAARPVVLRRRDDGVPVSALLASAAVAAAGERARRAGAAWRRVGVSVGIGAGTGDGEPANRATYVRVDVPAGDDVAAAVAGAIERAGPAPGPYSATPIEQRFPTVALRLLSPVVDRLSDTLLVSNLGRLDLAGVDRLAFHPVARGRSAVAVGCATVGGPTVVTLRARDLGPGPAAALLDDLVERLR